MAHIGVFIADKHQLIRLGLREVLKSEQYIDILGDCANPVEALSQMISLRPDIVLMGIEPEIEGIEATRLLKKLAKDDADVIILAKGTDYLVQAMEAGASGYLLKDISGAELAWAIRQVYCIRHPAREQQVELVIPPPVDAGRTLRFIEKLQEGLEVLGTIGSPARGAFIRILPKCDVPTLLEELRDMPDVEKVEQVASNVKTSELRGRITERMLVTLKMTAGA